MKPPPDSPDSWGCIPDHHGTRRPLTAQLRSDPLDILRLGLGMHVAPDRRDPRVSEELLHKPCIGVTCDEAPGGVTQLVVSRTELPPVACGEASRA